jgi:hypothetical protein
LGADAERGESGSGETEGSGVDHSASFHENQAKMDAKYKIAVYASLVANILLFLAKIYAFTYSGYVPCFTSSVLLWLGADPSAG